MAQFFARLVANAAMIVARTGVRAFLEAYQSVQGGAASKSAADTANSLLSRRAMTEKEARKILHLKDFASSEEVTRQFDYLFSATDGKDGSFYLQSKVVRAKECLDTLNSDSSSSASSSASSSSSSTSDNDNVNR